MLGRLIAAEFKSFPRKIFSSFDEFFHCVQSKYRPWNFASIRRFQEGCH